MKKSIVFLLLICFLLIPSCKGKRQNQTKQTTTTTSSIIQPKNMNDPELLCWIFVNCIGSNVYWSITDNFIKEVSEQTIIINGFNSIGRLQKSIFWFLQIHLWPERIVKDITKKERKETCSKDFDFVASESFTILDEQKTIIQNKDEARILFNSIIDPFLDYLETNAARTFNVLNWSKDSSIQGDRYGGYLIEYEIGEGYYVLLSLIEYKESNRYNAEIVYKGSSLKELNDCYQR